MKCQNCDGNGRFEVEDNGVVMQGVYWRCPNCGGKGIVEPLTNEEYIRSCSTEELAKALYDIRFDFQIPWKNKEIIGWLREQHK